MHLVVFKNPKVLLKRTMISCSSQTFLVHDGYKLSRRKKKSTCVLVYYNVHNLQICKCF